jgi:hypothetical protein
MSYCSAHLCAAGAQDKAPIPVVRLCVRSQIIGAVRFAAKECLRIAASGHRARFESRRGP